MLYLWDNRSAKNTDRIKWARTRQDWIIETCPSLATFVGKHIHTLRAFAKGKWKFKRYCDDSRYPFLHNYLTRVRTPSVPATDQIAFVVHAAHALLDDNEPFIQKEKPPCCTASPPTTLST